MYMQVVQAGLHQLKINMMMHGTMKIKRRMRFACWVTKNADT